MSESLRVATLPLSELRHDIEVCLDQLFPRAEIAPMELHQAMRYSVMAGGKRLRPILAIAAYRANGGRGDGIMRPACALELLHTYSLIHDDLPCMDDDDYRRGQPTLHRKFSEYVAVLAGDALHALAFEILAETGNCAVVAEISRAIGTEGMIGGQVRDVEAEGRDVTLVEVEAIHLHKTAALIKSSIKIGAMLARADDDVIVLLERFGEKLGLAFQIVDDILDVEGDPKALGKSVGSDDRLAKATYPKVVGIPASKAVATGLIADAKELLTTFPRKEILLQLADFILAREQ